jgi:hypothetical protein
MDAERSKNISRKLSKDDAPEKMARLSKYKTQIKELLQVGPSSSLVIRQTLAQGNPHEEWLVMRAVDEMTPQIHESSYAETAKPNKPSKKELDMAYNRNAENSGERIMYYLKSQEEELINSGRLSSKLKRVTKPAEFYESSKRRRDF